MLNIILNFSKQTHLQSLTQIKEHHLPAAVGKVLKSTRYRPCSEAAWPNPTNKRRRVNNIDLEIIKEEVT